jgi:hypothetical protein
MKYRIHAANVLAIVVGVPAASASAGGAPASSANASAGPTVRAVA